MLEWWLIYQLFFVFGVFPCGLLIFQALTRTYQSPELATAPSRSCSYRHLLLYRENQKVEAADASHLVVDGISPARIMAAGREYRRIPAEGYFFFWDELHDDNGNTVGYSIQALGCHTFLQSHLTMRSSGVPIDDGDVRLLIGDCNQPTWECVQGFGHDLYQSINDPQDCLLLMFDWSENQLGFELQPGPGGLRVEAA